MSCQDLSRNLFFRFRRRSGRISSENQQKQCIEAMGTTAKLKEKMECLVCHERGTEKKSESPMGIKPMTFFAPSYH